MSRFTLAISLLLAATACLDSPLPGPPDASTPTLAQLAAGEVKWVDLTHPLNEQNPYWPGDDYGAFEYSTIATLSEDGVFSGSFAMPEHLGTHLDAPNHFEQGQLAVDELEPAQLVAPAIVVDISAKADLDPDYRLSLEDLEAWETQHGPVPEGAAVLLFTGWSRYWDDYDRYKNQDVQSRLHISFGVGQGEGDLLYSRRPRLPDVVPTD